MLHLQNIKSILEIKADATLPITDKQLEQILAEFKKDWAEALTILWISMGVTITAKVVKEALDAVSLPLATGQSITTIVENWREDVLKPLYGDIIFTTGKQTTKIISNSIGSIMRFDITSPAIVNYIDTETLALAVDLRNSAFDNLQQTLVDSVNNKWGKVLTKDMLRDNMSLTRLDIKFIRKTYLNSIESETLRGIEVLKLSPSKARARAIRFANKQRRMLVKRKLNLRIERIHRTETVRMKHFSDLESLSQAELTGKINSAFKTWRKTNSSDNWNSTIINNGRRIPYKADWLPGFPSTASTLKYPSEINENCYQEYKVKFKKVA